MLKNASPQAYLSKTPFTQPVSVGSGAALATSSAVGLAGGSLVLALEGICVEERHRNVWRSGSNDA